MSKEPKQPKDSAEEASDAEPSNPPAADAGSDSEPSPGAEVGATLTFGRGDGTGRGSGSDVSLPQDAGRYRLGAFLGAGGMGEVFEAEDRLLGRRVALKFDRRGQDSGEDFAHEAMLQARLDHPNVPPVHDLMLDDRGRPFYAMRLIQGQSLQHILEDKKKSEGRWTLARLLALFQQACLALDFAHSKGVLHLDVKPANIMVGEFGELYVVDWGISGSVGGPDQGVRGTPAYMSPEQTHSSSGLEATTDVFSLGVVLYQIATGELPFRGNSGRERLEKLRSGDFRRGARWEGLPPELRDIIERTLKEVPSDRMASARALHDEIQLFLEGTKERERKRDEALQALARGDQELAVRQRLIEEADAIEAEIEGKEPPSWASAAEKREYWSFQDQLARLRSEAELTLERATGHFSEAHGLAPDEDSVRMRFGRHLWERFLEAEKSQDGFQMRLFEGQLRRLALPEYERALVGDGVLRIRVEPRPERVRLFRSEERDRRWVSRDDGAEFHGDVEVDPIAMGTYQVHIERDGYRSIEAPILIQREARVELEWRLRTEDEIGPDFVQIPPGPFIMGGDDETFLSVPRQVRFVPEFFLARFPVTWEQYRKFLRSLSNESDSSIDERIPKLVTDGERNWRVTDEGEVCWWRDPEGEERRRHWPIFSVDYFDAVAYCEWRSRRDGRQYRLPTDEEWEKAARGVDGRRFPWGRRYDASFCHNSGSTEHKAQPQAVGSFAGDVSPYGVRDLAGGVREWCSGWVDEKDDQRLVRGGSWNFGPIGAHCAYRMGCAPNAAFPFIGFRLAFSPGVPADE